MKKILAALWPTYSKWIDVECFESSGDYILLQMRINLKNNKKSFRRANAGFINDHSRQQSIYKNILTINSDSIDGNFRKD